jgi:hypothetical protein
MLRYPSAKYVVATALLAALTTGCGGSNKSASPSTSPAAKVPTAPAPIGSTSQELVLTERDDNLRLEQARVVGTAVLRTTLNADVGNTAVKQAIGTFAQNPTPKDAATGWVGTAEGKCSPAGFYALKLTQNEADTAGTQFNKMDTQFAADFNACSMKAGNSITKIDGALTIDLTLRLADLLNTASFSIATQLTLDNLAVSTNDKPAFVADGAAKYRFATSNGSIFTTRLEADELSIHAGNTMNLVDFWVEQSNNTATNGYEITAEGKYEETRSNTFVSLKVATPIKGVGYGYPDTGKLEIRTKDTNPALADENLITVQIIKTNNVVGWPPNGSYVRFTTRDKYGAASFINSRWDELPDLFENGFRPPAND